MTHGTPLWGNVSNLLLNDMSKTDFPSLGRESVISGEKKYISLKHYVCIESQNLTGRTFKVLRQTILWLVENSLFFF